MVDLRLVPATTDAAGESLSPTPIRVVLAEDHAPLRDALRRVLDEEDIEVIAQTDDLASALGHVQRDRPRVLVLDLGMASPSARETIGKLRARARHADGASSPCTRALCLPSTYSPPGRSGWS
jgi:CheY-like chemotaxis protein